MKAPKRLFKCDRVSDHHESVITSPAEIPLDWNPSRHVAHVPVGRFVELDCDHCLRGLERLGVRVDRSKGSSAIDIARNIRATDAVRDGFDSLIFIDSDILFDPADAVRLLRSPEAVIAGAYAAKKLGNGQLNVAFDEGVTSVRFGPWAERPYPVRRVGAGFLRIKCDALRYMAKELELPYCETAGRWAWPFFLPMVIVENGRPRYLGEDYAFCYRCRQVGIVPKVDTSFRVYHLGDYAYGLEEAGGQFLARMLNIKHEIVEPNHDDDPDATPPPLD
jgi:hypothetical protein